MDTDELVDQAAIVTGNGHTGSVGGAITGSASGDSTHTQSFTMRDPGETRLCEQCRKRAARPSSPTCANPECVAGHRRQRRRANYRNGNTPVPVPEVKNQLPELPRPAGRAVWELVAEAGPALLSVTFQFQDEPWVLTRAANRRNP
jgi:hypothetical protein